MSAVQTVEDTTKNERGQQYCLDILMIMTTCLSCTVKPATNEQGARLGCLRSCARISSLAFFFIAIFFVVRDIHISETTV